MRWMSPELIRLEWFGSGDSGPTMESDCYALGMVILEVLTGKPPFPRYDDWTVKAKVTDGKRPERPQGPEAVWLTDDLWGMLEQCWSPRPYDRPTAEAIFERLERGSVAWQPLPPTAGGDSQADSDDDSRANII